MLGNAWKRRRPHGELRAEHSRQWGPPLPYLRLSAVWRSATEAVRILRVSMLNRAIELIKFTPVPTPAVAMQTGEEALLSCCASRAWAAGMAAGGPYSSMEELIAASRRVWWQEVRGRRHARQRHLPCSRSASYQRAGHRTYWGSNAHTTRYAPQHRVGAASTGAPRTAAVQPHSSVLQTPVTGWLEAFAAHPKIGDMEGLRTKYGGAFGKMSEGEQAGASGASDEVLQVWPHCEYSTAGGR